MMKIRRLLWESKLAIALTAMILARCADRVFYTRLTYDFQPFLWHFSNIILPIAFILTSWPVVFYKLRYTDDITEEMRRFPHTKFMIMAFLDTAYNFLSAFPTPHIGGNLSNVLNQLNLPFNMILSYYFLATHFKRSHYLGSILVLYGGMVAMIPILQGNQADSENMPDPSPGWISLFVISLIPAATSNVYKEMALKDVDLDIWYTNAWTSLYQLLWGALSIWTVRIPAFCSPPVPWSQFIDYVINGNRCFFGYPVDWMGEKLTCEAPVFQVFLVFIIFNVTFNQLMLYVFKEGSSVLFVISSAVCLPITDLLYMIPLLTGPSARQKFTIYDGFALFVLVMGLLVYHSEKEERGGDGGIEKSPMYASPSLQKTRLMRKQKGKIIYHQSPYAKREAAKKKVLAGRSGSAGKLNELTSNKNYGSVPNPRGNPLKEV